MKIKRYLLDTNVITASMHIDDIHHEKAKFVFMNIPSSDQIIIPSTIYLELILGIQHFFVRKGTNLDYLNLIISKIIDFDDKFRIGFTKFVNETNLNLKMSDYTILYTAISQKAELITFDKKLDLAYRQILKSK